MKLLLTSAGIKNPSIHDALVDLLGKPIAESNALCIPTAGYGHPQGSPGGAWRFITGQASTPMCELGSRDRRPAGERRRRPVPLPLDPTVRPGGSLAVAERDGLGGAERREHGD